MPTYDYNDIFWASSVTSAVVLCSRCGNVRQRSVLRPAPCSSARGWGRGAWGARVPPSYRAASRRRSWRGRLSAPPPAPPPQQRASQTAPTSTAHSRCAPRLCQLVGLLFLRIYLFIKFRIFFLGLIQIYCLIYTNVFLDL